MPASDTADVLRLRGGVATPPPRPAWPATPTQAVLHLPLLVLPSAAAAFALPQLYDAYRAAPTADPTAASGVVLLRLPAGRAQAEIRVRLGRAGRLIACPAEDPCRRRAGLLAGRRLWAPLLGPP